LRGQTLTKKGKPLLTIKKTKPFTMKKISIIFSLLLVSLLAKSQVVQSNPTSFNTAVSAAPYTGLIGNLSNDISWSVSQSLNGPYVPAKRYTNNAPAGWCFNAANFSDWIVYPNYGCGSNLSSHACVPGAQDLYYKIQFNLSSNLYTVNWEMFADDIIVGVYVNSTAPVWTANTGGFFCASAINFQWCSNWVAGLNTVIVRTKSVSGSTGFKLRSLPVSTLTINGNSQICQYSTNLYNLSANPNFTQSPLTYSWTVPPNWAGFSATNTINATANGGTGLMEVTVKSGTACLGMALKTITVLPTPTVIVTGTVPILCSGDCATLKASGANTYSWYIKPPPINAPLQFISTNPIIVICPSLTTVYVIKGSNLSGCSHSRTITVTVAPKPNVSIAASSPSLCQGLPLTLSAQGNANTYTFFPGPQITNVATYTPNTTTTYTLIGRHTTTGCSRTATSMVLVLPSPTVAVVANPSVICPGNSSTLTASGAISYSWFPAFVTGSTLAVNPTVTTNYSVTGKAANGCTTQAVKQLTVLVAPTVTVSPPMLCKFTTNTLVAGGASTYTWTIGTVPITTLTGASATVNTSATSLAYTVCGTSQLNNCTTCVTGTLVQGVEIPIIAPNLTLCTNTNPCINIVATSTLAVPITYTWQPGNLIGASVPVCPTVSTNYTVSASSPSACPNTSGLWVNTFTNCCGQLAANSIPLTSIAGFYASNSYVLNTSITLTASSTFLNADILIAPDVSITVPAGMQLDLRHAHLYACGNNMWQGINVQDGGYITSGGSTMIEDAKIAIELDNISVANSSPLRPIELDGLIFNKNYIGIKISNSVPSLSTLILNINGCIFASRQMTFTTWSNPNPWPNSTMLGTGLKVASNPTTGLAPPYTFPGFAQSNLKLPYPNQPGHIGIKIENIGDPNDPNTYAGVDINQSSPPSIVNDFNLFDGLGNGIDVTDASLTTRLNVFQNMQYYNTPSGWFGGNGIKSTVTGLMNTRLALNQKVGLNWVSSTTEGNRFWNCPTGVNAENVYETWINYGLFRSTQTQTNALVTPALAGNCGVKAVTNRFHFQVGFSEFNNVKTGIDFSTPVITQNYKQPNTGINAGIFADVFQIESSYFGPEVLSATPIATEYMSDAILVSTPNPGGWYNPPLGFYNSFIIFNKIDRAFRGITVDGFEDSNLRILGNNIKVEDDFTFGNPAFGYGIGVVNNLGNLSIMTNSVTVVNPWYNPPPVASITAIYCGNNLGTISPAISCNSVSGAYYGFQFDGANMGTLWQNNTLCEHWAGLALTNTGVIGQQGNATAGSGNFWDCGPWLTNNPSQYETYVENSDPIFSPLYVVNFPLGFEPFNNNTNNAFPPYSPFPPSSIAYASANNINAGNCWGANNPAVPWWRVANPLTVIPVAEALEATEIKLYPNPTNGQLSIHVPPEFGSMILTVSDVAGKVVYRTTGLSSTNNTIDLKHLAPSIYIIELKSEDNKIIRKKLIKTE
jgi:hypothetical protein